MYTQISINRLKFLIRLHMHAPPEILSQLQIQHQLSPTASYLHTTQQDIETLKQHADNTDIIHRLPPTDMTDEWKQLITTHHRDILQSLKTINTTAQLYQQRTQQHQAQIQLFINILQTHQIQVTITTKTVDNDPTTQHTNPTPDEQHNCDLCNKTFNTKQRLQAHRWTKHKTLSENQLIAQSTVCQSCHRQFHTRRRLIQHLQYSEKSKLQCKAKILSNTQLLTQEEAHIINHHTILQSLKNIRNIAQLYQPTTNTTTPSTTPTLH